MADRSVRAIIQAAVSGDWSIPEFQREFEWKYEKVATLFDSLNRGLPIGLITLWNTTHYNEPRVKPVSGRIPLWIVDGQQRVTSLCIFAGRKPYWMDNSQWNEVFGNNRIFLNIDNAGEATIGRQNARASVKIPLDELAHRSPSEVQRYVQGKCSEAGVQDNERASDLAVNALRVFDQVVPVVEVGEDKAVEDIAEVYRRINQEGTRLRQAQIMLAYVSQYNPGWVRDEFYPYLDALGTSDNWELDPAHVLQVATIIAEGKARVGQATIPDMWQSKVRQIWPNLKDAVETSILKLWDKGITDQAMVPSSYTLIGFFAMHTKFVKFMNTPDFERMFRWFVLANLSGRYSDAPLESLARDGAAIYRATSFGEALNEIRTSWTRTDLERLLGQKFRDNSSQALFLHTLLWSAQATDWVEGLSIPALTLGTGKLESHWHHIVPQAWGKRNGFSSFDKTANVTRLCGRTNTRSSLKSKPPWEYVPELTISKEALVQHLIPETYAEKFLRGQVLTPVEFEDFLRSRERLLVDQGANLLNI